MLGQRQAATGERLSPRRLAQLANVPKDMVYRLDAGQARYVDLKALERLCDALHCRVKDILVWESSDQRSAVNNQRLGGDNGRSE